MQGKKYQIFISSTYEDLKTERQKVRDAILSIYHFPVGMELFGAANDEQWKIIKETIDSSDIYVLIIGNRYGSIIPEGKEEAGMSYTEKEFHYAKSKNIPILAFIIDKNASLDRADQEYITANYDAWTKLDAFKKEASTGRTVSFWSSADDLAQKVTLALHNQIPRLNMPGWIRGDNIAAEKSAGEIKDLKEQNSRLREENDHLCAELKKCGKSHERMPKFTVSVSPFIDDEEEDIYVSAIYQHKDLMEVWGDKEIHLTLKSIHTDEIKKEFLLISSDDCPNGIVVSDAEIEAYNAALPDEAEIDEYEEKYRLYKRLKENCVAVELYIHNTGTAKAEDVVVDVEIPEELCYVEIEDLLDYAEPEKPTMPENPIKKAISTKGAERKNVWIKVADVKNTGIKDAKINGEETKDAGIKDAGTKGAGIKDAGIKDRETKDAGIMDVEIDDSDSAASYINSLIEKQFYRSPWEPFEGIAFVKETISKNFPEGIMQKRKSCFGCFCLVPLKPCRCQIKVSILCKDFTDYDVQYIDVICEEET